MAGRLAQYRVGIDASRGLRRADNIARSPAPPAGAGEEADYVIKSVGGEGAKGVVRVSLLPWR